MHIVLSNLNFVLQTKSYIELQMQYDISGYHNRGSDTQMATLEVNPQTKRKQ